MLLTDPVVKDVVAVVNNADCATPNLTSFPSILPKVSVIPACATAWFPSDSLQKQTPKPITNNIDIATKIVLPSLPIHTLFALLQFLVDKV